MQNEVNSQCQMCVHMNVLFESIIIKRKRQSSVPYSMFLSVQLRMFVHCKRRERIMFVTPQLSLIISYSPNPNRNDLDLTDKPDERPVIVVDDMRDIAYVQTFQTNNTFNIVAKIQ